MSEEIFADGRQILDRLEVFSAWSDPFFEAMQLIKRGMHNEALQLLLQAEKWVPLDETYFKADVAERIGYCYHQLRQYKKAERYYEKALGLLSEEIDDRERFKLKQNSELSEEMRLAQQRDLDKLRVQWLTTINKQAGARLNALNRNYLWLLIEIGRTYDIASVVTRVAELNAKYSIQLADVCIGEFPA